MGKVDILAHRRRQPGRGRRDLGRGHDDIALPSVELAGETQRFRFAALFDGKQDVGHLVSQFDLAFGGLWLCGLEIRDGHWAKSAPWFERKSSVAAWATQA